MRIAITADHNGVAVKARLIGWLEAHGHEVDGHADYAIVVGGSGSGEAIACNKLRGIRAGLCLDLFVAEIARANNNANVLVTGAKVVDAQLAERIVETWLATSFRGGRHQGRIDQIA